MKREIRLIPVSVHPINNGWESWRHNQAPKVPSGLMVLSLGKRSYSLDALWQRYLRGARSGELREGNMKQIP